MNQILQLMVPLDIFLFPRQLNFRTWNFLEFFLSVFNLFNLFHYPRNHTPSYFCMSPHLLTRSHRSINIWIIIPDFFSSHELAMRLQEEENQGAETVPAATAGVGGRQATQPSSGRQPQAATSTTSGPTKDKKESSVCTVISLHVTPGKLYWLELDHTITDSKINFNRF